MKSQTNEQFINLESCGNKRKNPVQLELFPEQIRAQIVNILDIEPKDIRYYNNEIEPLDSSDM